MRLEIELTDDDVRAIEHQTATHPDDPREPEWFLQAFLQRTLAAWRKERDQAEQTDLAAALAAATPEARAAFLKAAQGVIR